MRIALQALQALLAILTAMIHHNAAGPLPAASAADSSRTAHLERVVAANPLPALPPAGPGVSPQSLVLSTGSGTVHPEPGKDYFVNLAIVDYKHGRTARSTATLQDFDGYSPEMQAVLRQMVAGEVRRIWTCSAGQCDVSDIELLTTWTGGRTMAPAAGPGR
jgi:plasmid stability protein